MQVRKRKTAHNFPREIVHSVGRTGILRDSKKKRNNYELQRNCGEPSSGKDSSYRKRIN